MSTPSTHNTTSSERIETLIKKYKEHHRSHDQLGGSPLLISHRSPAATDDWEHVNKELVKYGYSPVVQMSQDVEKKGYLTFNKENSKSLCHTILTLLEDLQRKNTLISELTNSIKATPTHHVSDLDSLKKQVAELQYTNAKLQVDLLNRPDVLELKKCQERVKQLEAELKHYKSCLTSDQVDLLNSIQQLKNIAVLLEVDTTDNIVPVISSLQYQVEQLHTIKPYLQSIVSLTSSLSHSDLLCSKLWSDINSTLNQWKEQQDGLSELQSVFIELYNSLEQGHPQVSSSLSCKHMTVLIKHWLSHRTHKKSAQMGVVLAMIHHFQQLFDIKSLNGVYPTMTRLYHQLNESNTAYKQLNKLTGGHSNSSWEILVMSLDKLSSYKDHQLYVKICQQYGDLSYDEIMECLSLCHNFFPPFHSLISDLQITLGVQSLSAILPEVKRLTYKHTL